MKIVRGGENKMTNNDVVPELSNGEFDSFISKGFVLIDFYAEWCLSPGTKLTFNPYIANVETVSKGSKILSFDEEFNEQHANVKSTFKIINNKRINIETERGRKLQSTPEHLILTKDGFKKAEELSEEDLVAVYLFNNFPDIEEDNRIFISEEKIRKNGERFSLNRESYIKELKDKNLLEIKYNQEKSYILANLLGFLLTDGSLSIQKNNERNVEFFVANQKDREELIRDLKFIGFKPNFRYQEIVGEINGRKFTQKIIRARITKTSFFLLMNTLGAIEGKKFIKGLKIPEWIKKGSIQIKKAFLQGFLGGDGPKAEIRVVHRKKYKEYNKLCINPIEFHFWENCQNNIDEFANDLSKMLNELGVKTRKIEIKKEDRYERKDKKNSILLKIFLNTDRVSGYNYCSIGFKYASQKNYSSSITREYLRERIIKLKEKEIINQQGVNDKNVRISTTPINYNLWSTQFLGEKNIIYDKIKKIEIDNGGKYPFISLSLDNNTKMFVANDIIHHNCMPCLMMAPVVDEMAEIFKGKLKVGKVNIDDNQAISQKYGVSSIPNFIIFQDGKKVKQFVGGISSDDFEDKIREIVK